MDLNDTPEQARIAPRWRPGWRTTRLTRRRASGSSRTRSYIDSRRAWQRKLAEAGLAARDVAEGVRRPGTRADRAGDGQPGDLAKAEVPGILDVIGIGMLGPCLIAHGSEEQKSRHLGPMLHGDEVWCQMFSEPAAGLGPGGGADPRAPERRRQLDAQRPEGVDDQRPVRVVRAAARAHRRRRPKHKGLTMFIVPMDAAGVTIRGLRQISGEAEFNEVFFDDVRLDARRRRRRCRQRLGHGADRAHVRAADDRLRVGELRLAGAARPDARGRRGRAPRPRRPPAARRRHHRAASPCRFNGYRALTALSRGPDPRPRGRTGEGDDGQRRDRRRPISAADIVGPDALAADSEWSYLISFLPGLKSAGGTEQILRNTIGERVLGLPPEPRLDKGVPFCELRAMEKQAVATMNFALSDEQVLLREAARGSLSRFKTIEAAREALEDPDALPDLWPVGGRGRLARAADRRGARRRRARARSTRCWSPRSAAACSRRCRCSGCCRRRRSWTRPATRRSQAVAAGELRPVVRARAPAGRARAGAGPWSAHRASSAPTRRARRSTATRSSLDGAGRVRARRAGRRSAGGDRRRRRRRAGRRPRYRRGADGVSVEPPYRYDATRSLGHVDVRRRPRPAAGGRRRTCSPTRGTWRTR